MNKRYPTAYPDQMNQVNNQMSGLNVTQAGFNKLWVNNIEIKLITILLSKFRDIQ